MTADPAQEFQRVFDVLKTNMLLLVSDKKFPNVSSIIADKPVKGSWWSHPLAHTIFGVNEILEDHKDVLITKLLDTKVTFVHRSAWKHIYAIGTGDEAWQTKSLSIAAKTLLKNVRKQERFDTSELRLVAGVKIGDVVRELEERLLIHAQQIHTESGAHSKIIETWDSWANRIGFNDRTSDVDLAKRFLHRRVKELNEQFGSNAKLPWN